MERGHLVARVIQTVARRRERRVAAGVRRRWCIQWRRARGWIELRKAIERLIRIAVLGPVISQRAEVIIERAVLLHHEDNVLQRCQAAARRRHREHRPTVVSLARVRLHSAAPEHAPVHPVKVEPPLGFAVSVTDVPLAKTRTARQPATYACGRARNRSRSTAGTRHNKLNGGWRWWRNGAECRSHRRLIRQQDRACAGAGAGPDQLVNSELASGFAVSVTDVPLANFALHAEPQLIPDGLLVTVPTPVPAF